MTDRKGQELKVGDMVQVDMCRRGSMEVYRVSGIGYVRQEISGCIRIDNGNPSADAEGCTWMVWARSDEVVKL